MSISSIIEKWDTLAYVGFNIIQKIIYYGRYLKLKKHLRKNNVLLNKHKGERCFIVLNGPSLNNYDLTMISDEYVFCTNYFYKTKQVDIIKPDYYCITDNGFFKNVAADENVRELKNKCQDSDFIFNIGYLDKFQSNDNIYFTYAKHMPNLFGVKNNLCTMSSGFISVSLYAINAAIFMGFKEIYLLGYDFEPGVFKHFYKDSIVSKKYNQSQKKKLKKDDVCGWHWQYSQAQYQNYYIQKYAQKRGVSIFNCNEESHVRSFNFKKFVDLFSNKIRSHNNLKDKSE